MKNISTGLVALILCFMIDQSRAQVFQQDTHTGDGHAQLHVNRRWKECSFQLNEGLSQGEFNEFVKEAGLVIYFRSMTDAKPLGARNFEVSVVQWSSAIDEDKGAWNDTFVHPDSTHWLVGGERLPITGFTARMGLTDRLDLGVYFTKNPGANYGFIGLQAQYQLNGNEESTLRTAVRGNAVRMYGPEDLNLTVYGADFLASREFSVHDKWLRIAPYVVLSTFFSAAHEKSSVVELKDERVAGLQGSIGVLAKVAAMRLAVEYNHARINTISMKVGVAF